MTKKFFAITLLTLTLVSGFVAGRVSARQTHMQLALSHLRQANDQLNAADPDKGGHRVAAMKLVNDAIAEVQAGIDYANRNR